MKKKRRKTEFFKIILIWVLVGIGVFLRVYRGDEYPVSQNDDGLFHVWAGNSIIDNWRLPTSLTIFESDNPNLVWRSQYKPLEPVQEFGFRLTDQYFDQPFLATLVIAIPARVFGYKDFEQIPQILVRLPALIVSVLTLFLTYRVGGELFGRKVGLWALTVLSFWPLAVWSQRQSFLENFISPLFLISLLGLSWYIKKPNNRNLGIVIASGVAAGWSKIIGFAIPIFSAFWLRSEQRISGSNKVIMAIVLAGSLYLVYGFTVGGSDFASTLTSQGERGAYFGSLFHVLTHPETFHEVVADGWWFLGFFALMSLSFVRRKEALLLLQSGLFWLVAMFATSGPENTSPWYRYPLFPLMALALGLALDSVWKNKNLVWPTLLYMLGMTGWTMSGLDIPSIIVRVGLGLVLIVFGVEYLMSHKWLVYLRRVGLVILITLCFVGNSLAIYKVPQNYCKDGRCLTPEKIEIISP